MKRQRQKFEEHEELKRALEQSKQELTSRHGNRFREEFFLSAPDDYLRSKFSELELDDHGVTVDDLVSHVHKLREANPNFLEPLGLESKSGQLHIVTQGANYEIAKLTASITGSYLFTDLPAMWKEIELDRAEHSQENKAWAPFAKGMQNTRLKYLNELDLDHALRLRTQGRLEGLRAFLHKVWRKACTGDPFDEANATLLASELVDEIRKAEDEWRQIDQDLLKIFGQEMATGLLAAGSLISSGNATFLAAAAVASGGSALVWSRMRRRGFQDKFPAAFFMNIAK
jgi:hypothetical protein